MLSILGVALLFLTTWNLLRNEELVYFLVDKFHFLQEIDNSILSGTVFFLTLIGVERIFMYLLFPVLFWMGQKEAAIRSILALLLGASVAFFIRYNLNLPGPHSYEFEILRSGTSFPSGHIVQYIMVIGSLTYYYQSKKLMWFLGISTIIMGVSRIFYGYHYLDDVVAGVILGAFLLYFFQKLINYLEEKRIDYNFLIFLSLAVALPFTLFFFTGNLARHNRLLLYLMGFSGGYALNRETSRLIDIESRFQKVYCTILGLSIVSLRGYQDIAVNRILNVDVPQTIDFSLHLFLGFFIAFLWPLIYSIIHKLVEKK